MKFESKPRNRRRIGLLAAALVLGSSLSAPVAEGTGLDCLVDYANCVDAASELDSFWRRSLGGLVCFSNLVDCLHKLLD